MKDQMTPKERAEALSRGEEVDRIPCVPDMGVTMAPYINCNLIEFYHSADKMVELELALYERLGHDSVGISANLRGVAEAMGAKMTYPDNAILLLKEPAVKSPDQIESLKPADPEKDGNLPVCIEALRRVQEKLGKEVDVGLDLAGPFSTAASILGTENLLKWMIKYPEKIHTLLEIITESNNRLAEKAAEIGASLGFSDPLSSTSLISEKQFREFSAPYIKSTADKMKELTGNSIAIHICGKSRDIWEAVVETGVESFSIDNVEDIGELKETVGEHIAISGNIEPVDALKDGSQLDVLESARKCLLKAHDSKNGYVLGSGCQIPLYTPMENIDMMMMAARTYGKWPIDEDVLRNVSAEEMLEKINKFK